MQQRVIPPWAVLDALSERDLYSYLIARRYLSTPPLYGQSNPNQENNAPIIVNNSPFAKAEEQYVDTQSRNKFDGIQEDDGSVNPRFLFNFVTTIGSTNSFLNPLQKTIYYFTTATTTFTFTTTCISTAQFAAGSSTVICRRRRDLLEYLSAAERIHQESQSEADISPSHVQGERVVPTARSMPDLVDEQQFHLASSKDEEGLSPETYNSAGGEDAVARYKRLFISTTIVTTYVFSTITTTRTLSANLAGALSLSCRPSQFTYC